MSRCFYRKLEANNITFLPEGLFDNLMNNFAIFHCTHLLCKDRAHLKNGELSCIVWPNLCNKITLMSRCFYRKLEANNITFLPEGLFDNLMNNFAIFHCTHLLCKDRAHLKNGELSCIVWPNLCNKITLMSRCFYRKLEANNITFLPEGLFDNLINLWRLWVNTSLFSLSNKLKRLSPKEPRDQPEVIRRTQGLKTSNSEEKFIYCCPILLCVLLKAVIFSLTQVIWGVMCALYKVISQFFIAHTYCASIVHI